MRRIALIVGLLICSLAGSMLPAVATTVPTATTTAVAAGAEVVTATSDTAGYHLFAAASGGDWQWRALATLQPAAYSDERWIGQHCVTGDGRFVVAVVAPWSANNSAAGIAAGGVAYAIDAHTGAVRPLATGVMLSYFDPGCGTGSTVALSRYTNIDQSATRIDVMDASTGTTIATPAVANQVTSAIPVDGTVFAAEGHRVVRIAASGAVTTVATQNGPVFDLTPNNAGGVDFVAQDTAAGSNPAVRVFRYRTGKPTQLATGTLRSLRLLPGINGQDTVVGARGRTAASIRTSVADGSTVADASTDGTMTVKPGAAKGSVLLSGIGAATHGGGVLPPPAPATTAVPKAMQVHTAATVAPMGVPNGGGDTGATCAVPRNDPAYQVSQPSDDQINWAIDLAGAGALPRRSSVYGPSSFGNYLPSDDFPLPAPFSATTPVPPQVMQGIFAQESNWQQASPHAPAGITGNPLIADYYGIFNAANSTGDVDFPLADCGYGLGQITDGMRVQSSGAAPTAVQTHVAVDYAENAAATAQILGTKWSQLTGAGITVGDDNPEGIENWYFAIWAYNSGVNPQASTGNSGGCTPGPSCTDSAGNWGLGWTNNPANPTYDPQRHPFLHDDSGNLSYGDAATPQDWPYQEKVFGWIESGQYEGDGVTLKYQPTYDYSTQTGYFLHLPGVYDFCDTSDNCAPGATQPCGYQTDGDPLEFHCWWHRQAPTNFCAGECHTGFAEFGTTAPEPVAANPFPSVCAPPSDFQATIIVDDTSQGPSRGCPSAAGANSVMSWSPNPDSGGGPFGDVDLHQLGTGYGGRTMFTHLEDPGNSAWGGTMTWTPQGINPGEQYDVEVFVPSLGAAGTLTYDVSTDNHVIASIPVNQNDYGNQWVSLGIFSLDPITSVRTTNVVAGGDGATDVAFDAVAFRPVSAVSEAAARQDLMNRLAGPVLLPSPHTVDDETADQASRANPTMDTLKIFQPSTAAPSTYYAVYTVDSTIKLAQSSDLRHWHYLRDLDGHASQPTIAEEADHSFVLADEGVDINGGPLNVDKDSFIRLLHFANLNDLLSGTSDNAYDVTRTLSGCNEGTPNIQGISADGAEIYLGFHWASTCPTDGSALDREGYGVLSNWDTMTENVDGVRDGAISQLECTQSCAAGTFYTGKHGGRDDIVWDGWRFSVQEAQAGNANLNDFRTWRFQVYDYSNQTAYELTLPSSLKLPPCYGNPKISTITDPNGREVILFTAFVFEASGTNGCTEDSSIGGPLVYTVAAT